MSESRKIKFKTLDNKISEITVEKDVSKLYLKQKYYLR